VISDSVNQLGIRHDSIKCDQIRNEQANLVTFIEDVERRLLLKRDPLLTKLNHQRVFVRLLNQPVTRRVEYFDCTAKDAKNFLFEQQLSSLVSIRVH
jgi:hypothetical protein